MKLNLTLLIFSLSLLSSCSSYMNSIYRDFENQDRQNSDIDVAGDSFDQYRKVNRRTSTEYNKPNKMINTANQKNIDPQVRRQYKDEKVAIKRYTASDLTDTGSDGSLWAGSDPNAFLFTNNKTKSSGDIVQINVGNKLKDEITMELKRAFPDNPYEIKAQKEGEKAKEGGNEKKPASVASDSPAGGASDVKDKISSVVVEEINREHLLIKGRKNVLFKNRKRMVEIQALVSRKDIGDDDTLNSDSILETNVAVVR
jgi:flagellar basal body L-ring protein FlgH